MSRLCSETRSEGPYTAPVDDPIRVMPSRERLLYAVRQLASACGELLCAVQSSSQISSANLTAVQVNLDERFILMLYDQSLCDLAVVFAISNT